MWRSTTGGPGLIRSIARACNRIGSPSSRRDRRCRAPASALAAKAATATIPIVFVMRPILFEWAWSATSPDPTATSQASISVASELTAKRLELLRELVPGAHLVGRARQSGQCRAAETTLKDVEPAARAMGVQIRIFNATTTREIDAVFANALRASAWTRSSSAATRCLPAGGFNSPILSARHAIAMDYRAREVAEAGGLMSYGTNIPEAYRQTGVYAGRILKGAKPADLPVVQATKFELVINAQTARMLGLTIPRRCSPAPTR